MARFGVLVLTLIFLIAGSVSGNAKYVEVEAQTSGDSVQSKLLQEFVITDQSARNRVMNARLGSESLELTKLELTPKMFGEADIIKSITLLPGIHGESDGIGGFEVRGGNAYQNLVTVDGMTLYNPSHLMGIFSTFNDDAMSRATIHKGPIPASFGGASSSVLETSMKSGDMKGFNFGATVGILNAKINAEGPIIKDKLSFSVAARRSYVDMFLKIIPEYRGTVMNFFDVNAKVRYVPDSKNTVDLSFFGSRDNLAISKIMEMRWGNLAGSVNWLVRSADNLSFHTTAAVTSYTTVMGMSIMDSDQSLTEYIKSFSLNEKMGVELSDAHSLEFGVRSEMLRVKSADMKLGDLRQRDVRSGWQNDVWGEYSGKFGSHFSLSAGIRAAIFTSLSGNGFHAFESANEETPDFSSRTYFHTEPRGSVKYSISDNHNIKAGVSLTTQNLHGVRTTTTTFPFDRYALTSSTVKPEQTVQYSAGYAGMTDNGMFDWSVEGYYKSMSNVYDYRDGVSMFSRVNLESLILCGRGRSYGLEIMFRKNFGKLTGWISYTLSKTETRIPGINDDRWYRASNDRRNDLALVALYEFNSRWNVSASWTYSSGRPLTAPDQKYEIDGFTCYYYSMRNSYLTPASHRLDLSATYTRVGKRVTSIWSFGIFNVYAHYSPFVIYFEDDPTKPSGTRAVQQSLFGIVPSVSYSIKF